MLDSGMPTARVRVIQTPHSRFGTGRRKVSFVSVRQDRITVTAIRTDALELEDS